MAVERKKERSVPTLTKYLKAKKVFIGHDKTQYGQSMGLDMIQADYEDPGQVEMNFLYGPCVQTADRLSPRGRVDLYPVEL